MKKSSFVDWKSHSLFSWFLVTIDVRGWRESSLGIQFVKQDQVFERVFNRHTP